MKKRNIAFAGVMAAILLSAGANAADISISVASKGYVDKSVGTLANLETSNKTDAVVAINEVRGLANTAQSAADGAADAASAAQGAVDALEAVVGDETAGLVADVAAKADKSDTYTKGQVDAAIANVTTGEGSVGAKVETLIIDLDTAEGKISQAESDIDALETGKLANSGYAASQVMTTDASGNVVAAAQIASTQVSGLADVATTGSYNSLSGTPTIPTATDILGDGTTSGVAYDIKQLQAADTDFDNRVDALETTVGDTTDGLVADVAANTAAIGNDGADGQAKSGLYAEIADLNTASITNSGAISTLSDRVAANETAIANKAAQSDLTALEGRVSTNEGDISTIEGQVGTGTLSGVSIPDSTAATFAGETVIQALNHVYSKEQVDEKVADIVAGDMTEALANYVEQTTYNTGMQGKQDKLSETQLAAVNSTITADKVTSYDGLVTKWQPLDEECDATSGLCVLSKTTSGDLGWAHVTPDSTQTQP